MCMSNKPVDHESRMRDEPDVAAKIGLACCGEIIIPGAYRDDTGDPVDVKLRPYVNGWFLEIDGVAYLVAEATAAPLFFDPDAKDPDWRDIGYCQRGV